MINFFSWWRRFRRDDDEDYWAECLCLDCGCNTWPDEWYAVSDRIWAEAGCAVDLPLAEVTSGSGGNGEFLCVGCLESRLGRRLMPGDFPSVGVNYDPGVLTSARLRSRLAGVDD